MLIKRLKLLLKLFIFFITQSFLWADAPYSYSYTPKFVYENQLFPVTVLIKYYNTKNSPNFKFDSMAPLQPIVSKPVKTINKDSAFFTFYFKAPQNVQSTTIPSLTIWNLNNSYTLNAIKIPVKKLQHNKINKNFSNLLASNLRITSTKVDNYDENHNLVTLSLEAAEANLENMHIPNVIDDGIENLKRSGAEVTANYYFIIPSKIKHITFSYYNTIKNRFINKKISLLNQKSSLDNSNLAPKEIDFDKIKKYFLITITVIFLIAYLLSRDFIYIFAFIISAGFLIYIYLPKKTICVQEGAPLYILPTNNSNICLKIDEQIHTKLIHRYNHFNKIEYKNSISGWIKDEDLCKN